MSEENVVHRKEKKNLRKSTDGYRTDSGCFEDVDVPITSQNPSTTTSSESVNLHGEKPTGNDPFLEEYRLPTEYAPDPCPNPSSIADECADDKDFHAILKRLSDLTTNPGDLYRLCFGSRLSFCGHMSGTVEREEPDIEGSSKSVTIHKNEREDAEIPLETAAKLNAERPSNEQQCVELLSLISSLMKKVKENPNFFKESGLGNSLVAQLSSLLPALEDSKRNDRQSQEPSLIHSNPHDLCISQSTTSGDDEHKSLVIPEESRPVREPRLDKNHANDPLQKQYSTQILPVGHNTEADEKLGPYHTAETLPSNQEKSSVSLELETSNIPGSILNDCSENQNKYLSPSCQKKELENTFPSSKREGELDGDTAFMGDPLESHDKVPFASTEKEVFQTTLPVVSFTKEDPSNPEHYNSCPDSECQIDNQCETPSLFTNEEKSYPANAKIPQSYKTDDVDSNLQHCADKVDYPVPPEQSQDNISVPNVNYTDAQSSDGANEDSRDVVMNGRRAVKPYSWDYGDIWEKELERARGSEAFLGESAREMMPSFEEIRDELFHNAGFLYDNSDRSADATKRRSRSADSRPSLPDDIPTQPEYCGMPNEVHSPFVRTIYQDENRPSTAGLRRSWSSHHIGDNSVMVNVDWERGRQVITGSSGRGFDSVHAQIIKEAVLKSSTFTGSRPWSALKRRPSGLRRRSGKNELFHSKYSGQSHERIDNDSESSDSPYVSATSSDCLTSATDDSSSVTSSPNYATSSLPSSPSVSNRNSACFSDTSTSDASDIRRVVFQSSPSELSFHGHYAGGYNALTRRGITLNERFREIESHYGISPNMQISSIEGVESPLVNAENFHEVRSRNVRENSYAFPRKLPNPMSPLLVRSDSDLNNLTKVEFVGDSYSRSRISKNVRHTRNRSQSPLSLGPSSAHTRVVSCEIVQSDNGKQDVYTKVNIAESLDDDRDRKFHDGWNNKMGYPSSRRSWHGQSSTRASNRYYPTKNIVAASNGSGRYINPLCSTSHQRYASHSKNEARSEKPVHATLVSVNNHKNRGRTHWSTGSLRVPSKEEPCRLSNKVTKRSRLCGHSTSNIEFSPHFEKNFQGYQCRNFGRDQSVSRQSSDIKLRSGRPRSPPVYATAMNNSQDLQRQKKRMELPANEKRCADKDSSGRSSLMERNRIKAKPKERMSHIVKETSFVGPSTFTKYQTSSNPSLTQARRSRSLNERDAISRRRSQDSDIYRRRALEANFSDGEYLCPFSRYDSDGTTMHRLDRRRRYSEGAACRLTRREFATTDGLVDSSYCDPHRESIREGTYSIVNAESAREKTKLSATHLVRQTRGEINSSKNVAPEIEWKDKKAKLVEPGKTERQRGMKKSNSNYNNDFTREDTQENRYSGTELDRSNSPKAKEKFTFDKPASDHPMYSTSSHAPEKLCGNDKTENVDYASSEKTFKKVSMESESSKIHGITSDRIHQPNIKEENISPVSPYCKTSYGNTDKSARPLPNDLKKIDSTVPLSSISDDASQVILAPELHSNKVKSNADFDVSNEVKVLHPEINVGGNALTEPQLVRNDDDNTSLSQRFIRTKKNEINATTFHQEIFPNQQVKVDSLASSTSLVNASRKSNEANLKHGGLFSPLLCRMVTQTISMERIPTRRKKKIISFRFCPILSYATRKMK
ncbi:uncharacterized protein LOC114535207 [Dendronephthya gigantea]|uniref:uncharacterized protein LOC114535207 n=1 Tax=Dendronephthya gigantea TaxID=151771 RepID=UPI00106D391A|nr:uncharacterized protein LOC114535207 [Dendronephthya gigantea]XP_028412388.1 uncharacterized protein LOC114535207 [Dendronephthya gigantea]XP_028412389.1 uncharacterized protein LOC114535207 [Dendronephthya gigantea]XP_028412390.1 uncharacterized protein LOC114535207 [Dendronephthya gigantea]